MDWDVLVVGAGFAGAVMAERLAEAHGRRVLVVDRRNHLAGNAHDANDRAGVRIHTYGPHWFRTSSVRVRDYLTRFTEWRPVDYRVHARARGRTFSFPINLTTYEQLIGRNATSEEMAAALATWREAPAGGGVPRTSEEAVVAQVGRRLYRLFYEGYTRKQWGMDASRLDASVCARIPVRTTRDERYVEDDFQALPLHGYVALFERLLRHPRIEVRLGVDFRALLDGGTVHWGHLVWTGMIDEYYDFALGRLPYRSLRFEPRTFERESFQNVMQMNYCDERTPFTRIVETKHATGQILPVTTVVREYPEAHAPWREAYYPMPTADARALHERYAARARAETGVTFIGRLATYRYWNMDQIVAQALVEAERLGPRLRAQAPAAPAAVPAAAGPTAPIPVDT